MLYNLKELWYDTARIPIGHATVSYTILSHTGSMPYSRLYYSRLYFHLKL